MSQRTDGATVAAIACGPGNGVSSSSKSPTPSASISRFLQARQAPFGMQGQWEIAAGALGGMVALGRVALFDLARGAWQAGTSDG
jgi:hypothetical protein